MKKNRIQAAWQGPAECLECSIRDLALFADLREPDFQLIHVPIDEIYHETGSTLYNTGDAGQYVFTLRGGLVKLVQYLPDGTQRIVRLLRQGAVAGLEVLLDDSYEHTAIALHPTPVCRIPVHVVNDLDEKTPRLHRQLMARWHESVRDADDWLTGLSTGSARARVGRLLLYLPASPSGLREMFNREDMGAMLGVTTETASRIMAEFRRTGVIIEKGHNVFECQMEALREIVDN
jgi:CRP/FNR family transcriptional regulator, anaerobic regulatory protein